MGKVSRKEIADWEYEENILNDLDEFAEDVEWWEKEQDDKMVAYGMKTLPEGVTVQQDIIDRIKEEMSVNIDG